MALVNRTGVQFLFLPFPSFPSFHSLLSLLSIPFLGCLVLGRQGWVPQVWHPDGPGAPGLGAPPQAPRRPWIPEWPRGARTGARFLPSSLPLLPFIPSILAPSSVHPPPLPFFPPFPSIPPFLRSFPSSIPFLHFLSPFYSIRSLPSLFHFRSFFLD